MPTVLTDPTGLSPIRDCLDACFFTLADSSDAAFVPPLAQDASHHYGDLAVEPDGSLRKLVNCDTCEEDAEIRSALHNSDPAGSTSPGSTSSIATDTRLTTTDDTAGRTLTTDETAVKERIVPENGRAIAIGENMGRVKAFAEKYGYEYFQTNSPPSQWMNENRAWVNARMDEG